MTPERSRSHQDRFRCPQCGLFVTVSAGFRREAAGREALVRFDCSMEGRCGSPIWDPCPMYLAYMERAPRTESGARAPATASRRDWARGSLKDAW